MAAFTLKSFFRMEEATWTETAYWVGSSYSGAISVLQAVLLARLQLLGFPAFCTGSRVSAIGHPGNSTSGAPPLFSPSLEAADPWTVMLVRLQGSAGTPLHGYFRVEQLRGMPNEWLPEQGFQGMPRIPALQKAYAGWIQALIQNQVCIKAEAGTGPVFPVLGVGYWAFFDSDTIGTPLQPDASDFGAALVTMALGSPATAANVVPQIQLGSMVGVHGVSWNSPTGSRAKDLNGSREVVGSVDGAITVVGMPPVGGVWTGQGTVQPESTLYVPITNATFEGVGEKKVGSTKYAHLGRSFPSGYIPAPPDVPVPQPPPLPVFEVDAGPGPFPGTIPIETARELCVVTYEGYPDVPPVTTKPLSIYQIINMDNCYYLCCSGTDSYVNPVTGYPGDITNGIGLPFGFPFSILEALALKIPRDGVVFMSGHSLGGMACENSTHYTLAPKYKVIRCVTFGAPIVGVISNVASIFRRAAIKIGLSKFTLPFVRFKTPNDPVPALSPVGLLSALIRFPTYTTVSNFPFGNSPFDSHTHYPELPSLDQYDVFGNFASILYDPDLFPILYLKLIYTVNPNPGQLSQRIQDMLSDTRRRRK
jgi:hypothetical protein